MQWLNIFSRYKFYCKSKSGTGLSNSATSRVIWVRFKLTFVHNILYYLYAYSIQIDFSYPIHTLLWNCATYSFVELVEILENINKFKNISLPNRLRIVKVFGFFLSHPSWIIQDYFEFLLRSPHQLWGLVELWPKQKLGKRWWWLTTTATICILSSCISTTVVYLVVNWLFAHKRVL